MITEEQAETIKQRLKEHIDQTFPDDRKSSAKEHVDSMSAEELEQFLVKNNLINSGVPTEKQKCVFCSIVKGEIPSYDISANEEALAVLEINPLSKGHTLIIPKDHVGSKKLMPSEVKSFAKRISILLKKRFLATKIKSEYTNMFGHEIINLIPVYEGSAVGIHRYKETPEQLKALRELLTKSEESKKPETRLLSKRKMPGKVKELVEKIEEKFFWLPKRIP